MENDITPTNKELELDELKNLNFEFSDELIKILSSIGSITNQVINKPTSLEKVFSLTYKLEKSGIQDICATVVQKLNVYKTENSSFEIKVYFNDKTHESFPSLESFMNTHETQPKIAKAIELSWKMTIYFEREKRSLKEKIGEVHEITIAFSTPPDDIEGESLAFYLFNGQPIEGFGIVHVSVKHSNKVWAVEVIKHIEDFLSRIEIQQTGLRKNLFKYRIRTGKWTEYIIGLSSLIPISSIIFLLSKASYDTKVILLYFAVAAFFFIIANILSNPIGRKFASTLGKLKPCSEIIINEFSRNLAEQNKVNSSTKISILMLFIIPIFINILSLWICIKIGLQ